MLIIGSCPANRAIYKSQDGSKTFETTIERHGAIRGLPGPRTLDPEPLRLGQVTPKRLVVYK